MFVIRVAFAIFRFATANKAVVDCRLRPPPRCHPRCHFKRMLVSCRYIRRHIMRKYDVIHKTGSTLLIATPVEEDRASAIGNRCKTLGEDWVCTFGDMLVDRQTDRRTGPSQYFVPLSGGVKTGIRTHSTASKHR